jgi:lipoprotein-anchoring transpeptidase ErfK/SrfK
MSSGAKWSSGNYSTPSGDFMTYFKRPSRHMASGSPAAATGYDLPGIPWVSYITESGISFHGTYWHNDFGRPRSHGCMNLPSDAARWIYRWTNPTVPYDEKWMYKLTGTLVQIS